MRDLSIYIHIPFCVRKCLYCDFLSFVVSSLEMESYVNFLIREIKEQSVFYRDHQVVSVFMGGGTPSLLTIEETSLILQTVQENYRMKEEAEITIECNPGTVTKEKFASYITCGINRLSIGPQSTQDEELVRIGRIHDYETFLNTYRAPREAGFQNINIDLMAALPGQSITSYLESLERVVSLAPEHISAYSLILEEGTPLYERQENYRFPTEDEDREMYQLTKAYLEEHGYHRYEISNYAKAGYVCRHNQVYWRWGLCRFWPGSRLHGAKCQVVHARNAERIQRLCRADEPPIKREQSDISKETETGRRPAIQRVPRSPGAYQQGTDGGIYVPGASHDVRRGLSGLCRSVWSDNGRGLWFSD